MELGSSTFMDTLFSYSILDFLVLIDKVILGLLYEGDQMNAMYDLTASIDARFKFEDFVWIMNNVFKKRVDYGHTLVLRYIYR